MIGKFLFFLSAATATFLGLSAGAVTTSQSIDIIVTQWRAADDVHLRQQYWEYTPCRVARQLWAGIPLRRHPAGHLSAHSRRLDACGAARPAMGRDLDLAREWRQRLVASCGMGGLAAQQLGERGNLSGRVRLHRGHLFREFASGPFGAVQRPRGA